tara:strand:- start:48 stop:530 length:483 start_codon:yes stop_codon:yes gene_type:complete
MEITLHDKKLKYENNKFYLLYPYKNRPAEWKEIAMSKQNKGYYSLRLNFNTHRKSYLVHRMVYLFYHPDWNIDDSSMENLIDHIDRDKTNNDIDNLRVVTHQENQFNRNACGVTYIESYKKWKAQITFNQKCIHLGYFDLEQDARNAYLKGREKYFILSH